MASYATGAQLLTRHDARTINDLANDDGQRIARVDLPTDANVTVALGDASGMIDAALVAGKQYTTDELEGLTGNSASLLQRITCDIAMALLFDRRPAHNIGEYERYQNLARGHLDRLRKGENVFNLADHTAVGVPTLDGPKNADYARLNLIPDRTNHYYPGRGTRLPTDRG